MTTKFTICALALSSAFLLPLPAAAQQAGPPAVMASSITELTAGHAGVIEVGAGPVSSDSFLLGKYTGLTDKGVFGLGNFIFRARDKWDSGGTQTWELAGTNLGLTSRSITGKYAKQGVFGVSFFYNQIPFYQSDSAWSVFGNAGGATLTLPANLPVNTSAALGAQLRPFLHEQDFSLDRKIVGAGLNVLSGSSWQFSTNISHERKEGLKQQSLSVNVRTDPTSFPEPVSYTTDTVEALATYSRRALQLQLGYTFSNFSNAAAAVILPSPYLGVASQPVGALQQLALPPGNTAHDVNLASAYNITRTTRVNVNLGYGLQMQNEPLLPYTASRTFPYDEPLPRTSLHGKVRTTLAQVRFSTEPVPRLDLSASYTYDKRANETPRDEYMSLMEPEWEELLNFNVPFGFIDQNTRLDAGYRFPTGTKVAAGYQRQVRDRTYAEVLTNTDSTWRVKLSQVFKNSNAYLSYLHGNRTGTEYMPYAFDFAQGNLPSTTPLLPYPNNAAFSGYLLEPNYYRFRRFFEADRTRNETRVGVAFDVAEGLSLDLSWRNGKDTYPRSPFGLQDSKASATAADLSYTAGKSVEIHGFYTYDSVLSDQRSIASAGITTNNPSSQWTWTSAYKDRVHTIGLGATFTAGKLKLGPQYEKSLANTDIDVVSGPGAGTSAQYQSKPVPTILTSSYGAKLFGEYALQPNASLRVVYDYEWLNTTDPALNIPAIPNVQTLFPKAGAVTNGWLLGGDSSGVYRIHIVSLTVIWRF